MSRLRWWCCVALVYCVSIINPWHTCATRITVLVLCMCVCVCVCVCVCLSVCLSHRANLCTGVSGYLTEGPSGLSGTFSQK